MKHLVASAFSAVVLGVVGFAFAADMPIKAVAPPPPPVATWAGLYVGITAATELGRLPTRSRQHSQRRRSGQMDS
jgi:hypothetical protein